MNVFNSKKLASGFYSLTSLYIEEVQFNYKLLLPLKK